MHAHLRSEALMVVDHPRIARERDEEEDEDGDDRGDGAPRATAGGTGVGVVDSHNHVVAERVARDGRVAGARNGCEARALRERGKEGARNGGP